jgi:hypothetical protein
VLSDSEFRLRLRTWISAKAGTEVTDQTRIFADRALRSVHVPELLLLMERLRGEPIDMEQLQSADFRDIDTLASRFGPRQGTTAR